MEINLLEFCKKYPGAFQAVMPAYVLGAFIQAYVDGVISRIGFKNCVDQWLEQIDAVGIINGRPMIRLKSTEISVVENNSK